VFYPVFPLGKLLNLFKKVNKMFAELLEKNVNSDFSGYNVEKHAPIELVRPYSQGEFCNQLAKPSRDLAAIQKIAHHDFEVEMKPVKVGDTIIQGKTIACEKGTEKTLGNGVVSDGYQPLQPSGLYDIANHILSLDESITVTDVVTRSDRYMIGLQLNKGEWSPTGDFGDRIKNNMVLFTTFDGSKPTSLRTVSYRPICSNQYAGTKHLFSVRHTRNAPARIAELKRLLTQVNHEIERTNQDIQRLVTLAMTNGQAKDWFSGLLLNGKDYADLEGRAKTVHDNKMSDFERLLRTGEGCEAGEGTRYAAFNALTNYCTHERQTRVTGHNGTAQELRWESNLFGTSADFAQRGVQQLVNM
jgi:hypothetical protein